MADGTKWSVDQSDRVGASVSLVSGPGAEPDEETVEMVRRHRVLREQGREFRPIELDLED